MYHIPYTIDEFRGVGPNWTHILKNVGGKEALLQFVVCLPNGLKTLVETGVEIGAETGVKKAAKKASNKGGKRGVKR